jgi:peptidoglycan/LPS O-acetylase OafA/YrhL
VATAVGEAAPSHAPDVRTGAAGEGYRPHLDGLRAVAVYLVVLFHAGAARFSGGFIGVDVFFVLSGYLVTQLLMRDLAAYGAIRFGRFYARRMRRLLPAAFATLVVTAIVYSAVASPIETGAAVNAFKASFLYMANWFFIHRSTGYFTTDVNALPVVHFWSLAVEEQFYLLWPILLGTLFALTRRFQHNAHRAMQVAVGAGALASVVWALSLAGTNLDRAYYGTDTRAYELLAGAFLALTPGLVRRASRRRGAATVAFAATAVLVLLSTWIIHVNAVQRGVATTITTVALIVAIEGARGGPVNRVLSSPLAGYLGQISYGTYLWHWPVIVVALALTNNTISPLSAFAISALMGTGLASLSYQALERPIRQQQFLNGVSRVVIVAGLSISVVAALVIIPYIFNRPYHPRGAVHGTAQPGATPIPKLGFKTARSDLGNELRDVKFLSTWNCQGKPASTCTIVKRGGHRILVIGDSHAHMMFPTFAKIAENMNLSLATAATGGCPWQRDLYDARRLPADPDRAKRCRAFKTDLYNRVIPALKPDLVIAIASDYRAATLYDRNNKAVPSIGATEHLRQIKTDTARSIALLEASAKKVVVVDPVPVAALSDDPFVCLTRSQFLEQCRFTADNQDAPLDNIYHGLADNTRVYDMSFDRLVCPALPTCDPVIGGLIVRWDPEHLTPKFALTLAAPVTADLRRAGLVSG